MFVYIVKQYCIEIKIIIYTILVDNDFRLTDTFPETNWFLLVQCIYQQPNQPRQSMLVGAAWWSCQAVPPPSQGRGQHMPTSVLTASDSYQICPNVHPWKLTCCTVAPKNHQIEKENHQNLNLHSFLVHVKIFQGVTNTAHKCSKVYLQSSTQWIGF